MHVLQLPRLLDSREEPFPPRQLSLWETNVVMCVTLPRPRNCHSQPKRVPHVSLLRHGFFHSATSPVRTEARLSLPVLPKLTPTPTTAATAPKKLDKRRLSTSSSNRCGWKSGYPRKRIWLQSLIPRPQFRNPVDPIRTPRIPCTNPSDPPLFIPLPHSPFLAMLRRPPTNRSNSLQSLTNQLLRMIPF